MKWDASLIVSEFESDYKILGDLKTIQNIASLDDATADDLTFCSFEGEKAKLSISRSNAGIILCSKSLVDNVIPKPNQQIIFLNNPKLVFVQFANRNLVKKIYSNISDHCQISEKAEIGKNCFIGDYAVIGKNSVIGDNSVIFSNVNISDCYIGKNCVVQSNSTIGLDGFGYERTAENSLERFPHFKRVIIGDNVEISSNCSIAKGSLTDTVINDGTKLDALVRIGHNVNVGKNCLLTAGTIVGGSSKIGNSCWLGINCTILDRINIGNNVIVGASSTVTKNISNNEVVAGVPAKPIKSNLTKNDLFRLSGRN